MAAAGGFNFGPSAQQTSGFSFGTASNAESGGFKFGQDPNKPAGGQNVLFGNPTSTTQPSTGFPFGAQGVASTGFLGGSTSQSSAGFAFGAPTAQTAPTTGFSLGVGTTLTSQPSTGFSFGAATTQTSQSTGFSLGGATTATQPSTGLSFGVSSAQVTPTTGFSLGGSTGAAFQPSTGSSFGTPATQSAPVTGFPLGGITTAVPQPTTTSVSFGTAPPQPSSGTTGFNQAPSTGFAFGTSSAPTAASTATGLFGTAPSAGFTLGGATSQNQPPASTGFSFNTATKPAATSVPASTPAGGFAFGGSVSNQASQAQPVPGSGTGGFTLGGGIKPATTIPSASGFSITAPATSTAVSVTPFSITTTATAVPASQPSAVPTLSGGFNFGGPGLKLPASTAPSTTSSTIGALGSQLISGAGSGVTVPAAASGATEAAGKQMTYRMLEEAINKWTTELEDQEKIFLQQATQVNAWDRLVMENGEKIVQLNKDVDRVKLDQQKLDHELDFIHAQQKELTELLEPLEKALEQLPPISYQQHADLEREHTYQLAESIDAQLKTMGKDLKEIIDRLNASNTQQDPNDPMQQITKILNAHMDSLLWIDRHTSTLNRQVEELSKQMDTQRQEQERNFRLAYS